MTVRLKRAALRGGRRPLSVQLHPFEPAGSSFGRRACLPLRRRLLRKEAKNLALAMEAAGFVRPRARLLA